MEFDKDTLLDFTFASKGETFDNYVILTDDEIVGHKHRSTLHEVVFARGDRAFRFNYWHDYEDGVDVSSFETEEVEPVTRTVTEYRTKPRA